MQLTELKRRQTVQNVLHQIQQMLPGHSAQEQQELVEQMNKTAFAAAQGEEEAYINKMAAQLSSIQRKLAKAKQAQVQQPMKIPAAASQLNQSSQGVAGRDDPVRVGSGHSTGSSRSMSHQHHQQQQQMMQQQQAMLTSQHHSQQGLQRQFPGTQHPNQVYANSQHPPAPGQAPWQVPQAARPLEEAGPPRGAAARKLMFHSQQLASQPRMGVQQQQQPQNAARVSQLQHASQRGMQYPQHQQHQPHLVSQMQLHAVKGPSHPQRHVQASPQPQRLHQEAAPVPLPHPAGNSGEFELRPASPNTEQFLYGMGLLDELQNQTQQQQHPTVPTSAATSGPLQSHWGGARMPQPIHQAPSGQQPPQAYSSQQPAGFPANPPPNAALHQFAAQQRGQPPSRSTPNPGGEGYGGGQPGFATQLPRAAPPGPQQQQQRRPGTPSFMELLTSDAPGGASQSVWQQQQAPQGVQPATGQQNQPGNQALPPHMAQHQGAGSGSRPPSSGIPRPDPQLSGGSEADFTEQYWELMGKIQREIVPILERLQAMLGAGKRMGGDSEKVAMKLTEILSLLPRFKIQRTDAKYSMRVWSKKEYDHLEKIQKQLGPYCKKFSLESRTGSGSSAGGLPPKNAQQTLQQTGQRPPAPSVVSQPQQYAAAPTPPQASTHAQQPPPVGATHQHMVKASPPLPQAEQELKVKVEEEHPSPLLEAPQLRKVAADFQAGDPSAAALALRRMLWRDEMRIPKPPKQLMMQSPDVPSAAQVMSKRALHDVVTIGFSPPSEASPTSVLDCSQKPKRAKRGGSISPEFAQRQSLLETECKKACAMLGPDMLLHLAKVEDDEETMLVRISPRRSDSATDGRISLVDEWKTLTLHIGPTYPEVPPIVTLHGNSIDGSTFYRSEAARDAFETGLAAEVAPLRVHNAAQAWQNAITTVTKAYG